MSLIRIRKGRRLGFWHWNCKCGAERPALLFWSTAIEEATDHLRQHVPAKPCRDCWNITRQPSGTCKLCQRKEAS